MAVEAVEAIFEAAMEGDIESVARMLEEDTLLLLDEDPGVLASTWNGRTLLMWATVRGDAGMVRYLLEQGAQVNTAGVNGHTALHSAVQSRHEEVVSLLLSSGADPSRVDEAGRTALMHASISGHVPAVRLLLQSMGRRGLDERNVNGWTAVYYACRHGHADILQRLLLAGADHTIATNTGTTPQEIARRQCHAVLQWWETEPQRPYVLHKARALHDDTAAHQHTPAAPVPAYLSPRAAPGCVMPCVEVGAPEQGGQGAKHDGSASREEELCAMVGFVVKVLAAELYIELLEGLHH